MLMATPRYFVASVVEKYVLKVTLAVENAGCPVEVALGQSHKYNYRVDTLKTRSLGGWS